MNNQIPNSHSNPSQLLQIWCDALLAHQIPTGEDRGGLKCPACGFVHGRCGDTVYPFMALFSRTGEEKYRRAALEVYDWSERHVAGPNGSWLNESYVGAWQGISCFSALALGETLRHYGDFLTPETRQLWRNRLRRGADFLLDFMTFEVGDINYPISTSAALALAWTLLGDEKYRLRAHELAYFGLEHFTAGGLLWGEGPRGQQDVSPRGLRPIDVSYNVEESLPNLLLYGELTGDEKVLEAVTASLRSHLAFLLPDGGWDAGWCSRQYKWTYWGSRTSDGCTFAYAALQSRDPRFAPAAALNLHLLEACTYDGLLSGGLHLHSRGIASCIHHTFCHAKGLAAALDAGLSDEDYSAQLNTAPESTSDGVREWPEAAVFQIVCGPWRASVTANDLPHTPKRGGYPSGGALSLLWHENTGPLCVASMSDYVRYEGVNMQEAVTEADKFVLTPRLEIQSGDDTFSNLHDGAAQVNWQTSADEIEVKVQGILKNQNGALEGAAYTLIYRFSHSAFELVASCDFPGARLVFPLISPQEERANIEGDRLIIHKSNSTVFVDIAGGDWDKTSLERVFNFVPGVEAIPISVALTEETRLRLS